MRKLLAGLLALALIGPANAAAPPTPPPTAVLQAQTSLSVSNSSARVALATSPAPTAVTIFNSGATDAYFAQGGVTVVATTSSLLIPAGKHLTIWVSGTYLAAITASSTTTLIIYESSGPLEFGLLDWGKGLGSQSQYAWLVAARS